MPLFHNILTLLLHVIISFFNMQSFCYYAHLKKLRIFLSHFHTFCLSCVILCYNIFKLRNNLATTIGGVFMYSFPVSTLQPGMVLYDDLYTSNNSLLLKANTLLTEEKIQLLKDNSIDSVSLAEPLEINITHYQYLYNSEHFKEFCSTYESNVKSFKNLVRLFETGLEVNLDKFLELRNSIMSAVRNEDQLIDYLYYMMPDEKQLTYIHCFNCGLLCYVFAKWCGLSPKELDLLTIAGFAFDIGKVKLSDDLLWKDGKLTPEEIAQLQRHIHMGYDLIKYKNLPPIITTVLIMHHERRDGSGYPAGIKADKIHPYALLAGIADIYEAVTHPRAQRSALTPFQAIGIFEQQGFEKTGVQTTKKLLSHIAQLYLDRRVTLSNQLNGRICEIHGDALSKPTIFCNNQLLDLREHPELEIIRMS